MNKFLITIVGPTAIGKTSLAIKLAKHYQTEVISADSRQFYKELNIGTAKPTSEELSSVKHHLINNISVTDDYDISQFQSDAREKINNVFKMKDFAIMVGGSGLYIDSVLYGIDEIPKVDISIRENLNKLSKENNFFPIFPPINLCGDNAAMIAWAGIERYKISLIDNLEFPSKARWPLDSSAPFMKGPGLKI